MRTPTTGAPRGKSRRYYEARWRPGGMPWQGWEDEAVMASRLPSPLGPGRQCSDLELAAGLARSLEAVHARRIVLRKRHGSETVRKRA